ncbi:MAG: hypothetical protein RM368_19660 [Nostoc sp. DedSLP03]|uniref:hypothetical protein n=1 Tax=Nostoc sp. DedSLP03 TaxID=3075400 RepID=UPI002AD3092E|nr:hypothetical protein [Nostoc sp. DedSLP03]MDZ7967159.1 hypothetical protein [Nostoc sp. DedSLP03]
MSKWNLKGFLLFLLLNNLLFFNIILINLLVVGCAEIYSPGDEPQYEKIAEDNIISMIQNQKNYFSIHKTFLKPLDKPLKSNSSFFKNEKCYGYYTKTIPEINGTSAINGIYIYARQEACDGNWGIDLSSYVGGVFVVPIIDDKEIKVVSIVCKSTGSGYAPLNHRPYYTNGLVDCPPEAKKVYLETELFKNKNDDAI